MKTLITMLAMLSGISSHAAINQNATNSDCGARVVGKLDMNTNTPEIKRVSPPTSKPAPTQNIASGKSKTIGT